MRELNDMCILENERSSTPRMSYEIAWQRALAMTEAGGYVFLMIA
jgi:hypothetical protein